MLEILIESLFFFSLNCIKSSELPLSDPLMEQQTNISVKLHKAPPDPSQTTAAYGRSSLESCGLNACFKGGGGVGPQQELTAVGGPRDPQELVQRSSNHPIHPGRGSWDLGFLC